MRSSEIRASRFVQLQKATKRKERSPDSHEFLEDPCTACRQAHNFVPEVTTHKVQLLLLDRGRQKKSPRKASLLSLAMHQKIKARFGSKCTINSTWSQRLKTNIGTINCTVPDTQSLASSIYPTRTTQALYLFIF